MDPQDLVLRASRLTEDCVGEAFALTSMGMHSPENEEPLRHAGRMFGRLMYLMDAVRDYWQDMHKGLWAGEGFNKNQVMRFRES